jgi:hypothetical protein
LFSSGKKKQAQSLFSGKAGGLSPASGGVGIAAGSDAGEGEKPSFFANNPMGAKRKVGGAGASGSVKSGALFSSPAPDVSMDTIDALTRSGGSPTTGEAGASAAAEAAGAGLPGFAGGEGARERDGSISNPILAAQGEERRRVDSMSNPVILAVGLSAATSAAAATPATPALTPAVEVPPQEAGGL